MENILNFDSNIIFKYGTIKHLEDTVLNNSLGFSKVGKLNDPFEIAHRFYIAKMSGNDAPNSEKFKKLIEYRNTYLNDSEISCFSRIPNEPLMWAHYADKHNGICYCFDENQITTYGLCSVFEDVTYSNQFPKINIEESNSSKHKLTMELNRVLMTKSLNWFYEKEFRIILKEGSKKTFRSNALKAVIIGINAAILNRKRIISIINKANENRDDKIKIYYACMSELNYDMIISQEYSGVRPENIKTYI